MQKKVKQEKNILFPTMWEVFRYRMLWRYHSENEFDQQNFEKWKTEAEDTVLKVYNYEFYNRVMQGEKTVYTNVLDAYKYFLKIKNKKAAENMAWLLRSFNEFDENFKIAIAKENYKKADFFYKLSKITRKPDSYLIELDETFIFQKQNIIDDIKYLEKEQKKKKHKIGYTSDLFVEMSVDNPEYILLGTFNNPSCIAETLQTIQNNKELLYILVWAIHTLYKDYIPETIRNLNNLDSKYIIKTITEFDIAKSKRTELRYFTKVTKLIKEQNKVNKKVLVNTLKYFNKKNNIQQDMLNQIDKQILYNSLEYANEIEEYELSQLINQFISNK